MSDAILVEKETVDTLVFPDNEVLNSKDELLNREISLKKAASLGNGSKFKVKIFFEDNDALKVVNTTIWAVTEKNIVLKAGRTIPRKRIHSIHFV